MTQALINTTTSRTSVLVTKAPIQERALLAALNISQWTARKRDKKVSSEATEKHGASSDAGNFNKLLIGKDALEDITKVVSAARTWHYDHTLGWGDNGDRIMPGSLAIDYIPKMDTFKEAFYKSVRALETAYPSLVQARRAALGTMYDPADYPPDISNKFHFAVNISPLATAADFRVNLSTEHVDHIKRSITAAFEERQRAALKECWARVRDVVSKIHEQTSDEDRKIFDSAIENARDLVKLLPALNITGDADLDRAAQDIDDMLVPAAQLRGNSKLRKNTADAAGQLLAKLPWA